MSNAQSWGKFRLENSIVAATGKRKKRIQKLARPQHEELRAEYLLLHLAAKPFIGPAPSRTSALNLALRRSLLILPSCRHSALQLTAAPSPKCLTSEMVA